MINVVLKSWDLALKSRPIAVGLVPKRTFFMPSLRQTDDVRERPRFLVSCPGQLKEILMDVGLMLD